MEYPLIIDGLERAKLRVQREGLYTVFEAELADVYEGLYRIWLHGGGESAYLGLMQPWSGGMYLRRKLSRSELKSFPAEIEYASNQVSLHNQEKGADKDEVIREKETINLHNNKENKEEKPKLPPIPDTEDELLWFRRPDGSLVSFDGERSLVALPVQLRHESPGAVLRRIEGREYMIFRY